MNELLKELASSTRLLFSVPLRPLQGDRFQPTGFPSLGAATYQSKNGEKLLVESAQSMANRLEAVCWNAVSEGPVKPLSGISHVRVTRSDGSFYTDSMTESHRLNSPYILDAKVDGGKQSFHDHLKGELGGLESGPVNRQLLAKQLLRFDIGSLVHGIFLARDTLAGGRLRLARALSAFIEADGVKIAASGGVKNDHVDPQGETKKGFGNVPFARDEFTADHIYCHINLDLSQIRGYGLDEAAEQLLVLLSLFKVRKLLDGDLRLRTACDLEPIEPDGIVAKRPDGFVLPSLETLDTAVREAVEACKGDMSEHTVVFEAAN